jgi:multimeric flavodoxin WrbA
MALTALALNCSLKADGPSSTDGMITVLADAFEGHGIILSESIRIASLDVKTGVSSNEGDGDDWPMVRRKILDADILIFGTPIWMGQMGSVAKKVLERIDAFFSETDDKGRMPSTGKVAVAAIVGNEDGAHITSAQIFQSLNDTGFTIPASAACYWVGEAMQKVDFKDLPETPIKVLQTAAMAASNAAHLATLLKTNLFPGVTED